MIRGALDSLDKRLERESEFRRLSGSDLKALIRKQTIESISTNGGSKVHKVYTKSPETIGSSPGLEGSRGVEGWVLGSRLRTKGARGREGEVNT